MKKKPYLQESYYHSWLRILAAVFALVLLFDSGVLFPSTQRLSQNTQFYLANSVGVSAGVEQTELSMLTAELTEQKQSLAEREAAVAEREIAIQKNSGAVSTAAVPVSTYILSTILFILLVLIVLNYGLDYVRYQRERVEVTA